jgi:mRNA-degrading endonuclease RelE of RelBE toxin-antitoxin system
VVEQDLPGLAPDVRRRVIRAIESKIAVAPETFGKPLRSPLAPFRSLRAGDYRIVYLARRSQVVVLAIGHRREIYRIAGERDGEAG